MTVGAVATAVAFSRAFRPTVSHADIAVTTLLALPRPLGYRSDSRVPVVVGAKGEVRLMSVQQGEPWIDTGLDGDVDDLYHYSREATGVANFDAVTDDAY